MPNPAVSVNEPVWRKRAASGPWYSSVSGLVIPVDTVFAVFATHCVVITATPTSATANSRRSTGAEPVDGPRPDPTNAIAPAATTAAASIGHGRNHPNAASTCAVTTNVASTTIVSTNPAAVPLQVGSNRRRRRRAPTRTAAIATAPPIIRST